MSRGTGSRASFLRELPVLVGVALVLALVLKALVVQAFYIPSGSMENTLEIGDRVLVEKLSYDVHDVHRGDVVVFNGVDSFTPEVSAPEPGNAVSRALRWVGNAVGLSTLGEKDFIKRVIGVGGDTVRCCDAQGRVEVNGRALHETYLLEDDHQPFGPVTVPKGRLWVMGDHRGFSSDSRLHGTIPAGRVIGRAFVIVWPVGRARGLGRPATLAQRALDAPGQVVGRALAAPGGPLLAGGVLAVPLVALRRSRRRRARAGSSAAPSG